MDTFKKSEYNLICKVFSFFNHQNSTFHHSNSYSPKGKDNLVTVLVVSLTTWIDVVTINSPTQGKFSFQLLI